MYKSSLLSRPHFKPTRFLLLSSYFVIEVGNAKVEVNIEVNIGAC